MSPTKHKEGQLRGQRRSVLGMQGDILQPNRVGVSLKKRVVLTLNIHEIFN